MYLQFWRTGIGICFPTMGSVPRHSPAGSSQEMLLPEAGRERQGTSRRQNQNTVIVRIWLCLCGNRFIRNTLLYSINVFAGL